MKNLIKSSVKLHRDISTKILISFSILFPISLLGIWITEGKLHFIFTVLFFLSFSTLILFLDFSLLLERKWILAIALSTFSLPFSLEAFLLTKDFCYFLIYGEKAFPHVECIVDNKRIEDTSRSIRRSYLTCRVGNNTETFRGGLYDISSISVEKKITVVLSRSLDNTILWIE